jgi:hypothetical protein
MTTFTDRVAYSNKAGTITRRRKVARKISSPPSKKATGNHSVHCSCWNIFFHASRLSDSFGLYNFAVAHKDLPDDLVYRLVRAVFVNHAELVKAEPSAKETIPANVGRNTILPLHPGAVRYYREIGTPIPVEQTN